MYNNTQAIFQNCRFLLLASSCGIRATLIGLLLRGVQCYVRILLLSKNELFHCQAGKVNNFIIFFAKINIFILSEIRISTKT